MYFNGYVFVGSTINYVVLFGFSLFGNKSYLQCMYQQDQFLLMVKELREFHNKTGSQRNNLNVSTATTQCSLTSLYN